MPGSGAAARRHRILVHVEDEPIHLWPWSRVRHAVLRYSEQAYRLACMGLRQVVDAAGQPLDLDGALEDGVRLYLRRGRGGA